MKLHKPVLLQEFLEQVSLAPYSPLFFLDGTFGRGGHTKVLLDNFPKVVVVGLDKDPEAIEFGKLHFQDYIKSKRLILYQSSFENFKDLSLPCSHFDSILLDLGVSSPQLEQPERGFSFYKDGPLDMRMDSLQKTKAFHIVNEWREEELVSLFIEKGEVHSPYKVVRAVVRERKKEPIETTLQLAHIVEKVEGWRRKGHHPATKFFLALRLEVNQEMEVLKEALPEFVSSLGEGGRFFVITFHSLEDRLVKRAFRDEFKDLGFRVNKKVIQASREEKLSNPRSRSAKMRVFQKGGKI